VRSLVTKWSESILEIPTLVGLGYGGVPSPVVDKDEDDVSSWGSGNDYAITADERRLSITRSRSFSKFLKATLQGRNVSVTAEEKDIIARLAAIAEVSLTSTEPGSDIADWVDRDHTIENLVPTEKLNRHSVTTTKSPFANTQSNCVVPLNELPLEIMNSPGRSPIVQNPNSSSAFSSDLRKEQGTLNDHHKESLSSACQSYGKGRKVMKAGRRLLASFSSGKNGIGDHGNNTDAVMSRKRATEIDVFSREGMQRAAKVSRRNNIWAFNERKKIRSRLNNILLYDKSHVNLTTPNNKNIRSENEIFPTNTSMLVIGDSYNAEAVQSPGVSPNKRHPFTDDEISAIKDGVKVHGVGQWTVIQESDERLANRRPGQLKDKYRTMTNKGQA
jgi:hypothetical protein